MKQDFVALQQSIHSYVTEQLSILKKSFESEWKSSADLREVRDELENDIEDLETRLQAVINDLIETENKLTSQIEENWRIKDAKELLEKQISKVCYNFNSSSTSEKKKKKKKILGCFIVRIIG